MTKLLTLQSVMKICVILTIPVLIFATKNQTQMDQDKRQHNFHKMTGIHSSSEIAKARFANR